MSEINPVDQSVIDFALSVLEERIDTFNLVLGGSSVSIDDMSLVRNTLACLEVAGICQQQAEVLIRQRTDVPIDPELNLYQMLLDLTILASDKNPPSLDPTTFIF